jgi:hypothetical protein
MMLISQCTAFSKRQAAQYVLHVLGGPAPCGPVPVNQTTLTASLEMCACPATLLSECSGNHHHHVTN